MADIIGHKRRHVLMHPVILLSEVSVQDLTVLADIGVFDHEIGNPQPLIINTTLKITAPEADVLDGIFDYRDVVNHAGTLAAERIALIEIFALRLATLCLKHPTVIEADITIRKPNALEGCMAGTRVVLARNP